MELSIRQAEPRDYEPVLRLLRGRWGGKPLAAVLPRHLFARVRPTSVVAEEGGELRGALVGFRSPARPERAYVHLVGVDPRCRGQEVGRLLYERFLAGARALGCTEVAAVGSPLDAGEVARHLGPGGGAPPGTSHGGGDGAGGGVASAGTSSGSGR